MTAPAFNLLTQPLIHAAPLGFVSLPGLMAALARDEVESFPALRPHQGPAWHMFLVQLAALALHRAGRMEVAESEGDWLLLLRALTPGFEADEPWCLVVDDWAMPAFLQPPVPKEVKLGKTIHSPDSLDLLNTAKNHDLKQAVARKGEAQDWVFALVSLQTGGTYSKAGRDANYWSAVRTGNIYAPRLLMSFAPMPPGQLHGMSPRLGAWLMRDLSMLLETRDRELESCGDMYSASGGLGLTWVTPWPGGEQLQLNNLDIWFIEVCRRLRLLVSEGTWIAQMTGTEKNRINDYKLGGRIRDPWTPEHKDPDGRGLALSKNGLSYKRLSRVLFGDRENGKDFQDWNLPLLLKPSSLESQGQTLLLIAQGIVGERQKSGTLGFKSRILPIGGKVCRALSLGPKREELHKLAQAQMEEISKFDKALAGALALAAARGDWDKRKKEHYVLANDARSRFDRAVDDIFFLSLWARFDAQERDEDAVNAQKTLFAEALHERASSIFEAALPAIPCAGIFRPRAEARARRAFEGAVWRDFPELFPKAMPEETDDAA